MNNLPATQPNTELPLSLDETKIALALALLYVWGPECFEVAHFFPDGKAVVVGASARSLDTSELLKRSQQVRTLKQLLRDAFTAALAKVEHPPCLSVEYVTLFPNRTTETCYEPA